MKIEFLKYSKVHFFNSLVRGFSKLDISAPFINGLSSKKFRISSEKDDEKELYKDWDVVGQALISSMDSFKNE